MTCVNENADLVCDNLSLMQRGGGLTGNIYVSVGGDKFLGTIYAAANVAFGGGGYDEMDFTGAGFWILNSGF
jgi:hypothetical protein